MDISNSQSQFLNLQEHAAEFRLAINTVRNRILKGTWPARTVRIGKNILIPRAEHERVINEMLAGAGMQPAGCLSTSDPNPTPCQTYGNLVKGTKKGRGRPRKCGGEVK